MSAPAPSVTPPAAPEHARLGSKQHSDGGWGLVPIQVRSARFASYDVGDFDEVTGRELEWKYTPIPRIAALLAAGLDGSVSEVVSTIDGDATVEWVGRDDARLGAAGKPDRKSVV